MTTTAKEKIEVHQRLATLGITDYTTANTLRRIAMTLQRWFELECGDSNNYASWAVERDKTTEKPYLVHYPHDGKSYRTAIADRETGARKRLAKVMKAFPELIYYVQTDPRGASLYILRKTDLRQGEQLDCVYNRGVAVY